MIQAEIKLNNGTIVWIDAYFVSLTYDVLEGDDCNPRANAFVLSMKEKTINRLWPSVESYFLGKVVYESNLATPLPGIAISAIVKSLWKSNESEYGSHLAIFWLQDEEWPILSVENLERFKAINWHEVAADFSD